jgi:hypothetical protein
MVGFVSNTDEAAANRVVQDFRSPTDAGDRSADFAAVRLGVQTV